MLVTLCTIRQLPQAIALADSFIQNASNGQSTDVLIGLADDPAHLPPNFSSPYTLLPVTNWLSSDSLATLSATYTPTEFAAACKPQFLAEVFRRYPNEESILYADPNVLFTYSLTSLWEQLATKNILLTPFITKKPDDTYWPDEKYFQNVGLYCSDFLALRRSSETERMLAWWADRVQTRAYINFCEGLCLDQLWLMHVPIFFNDVAIIRNPGWHVALWNLPERVLRQERNNWYVDSAAGKNQPLLFVNFKGLLNVDEGLFPHQNRIRISEQTEITTLLNTYRTAIKPYINPYFSQIKPAYGQKPEPVVLRGWRYAAVAGLRTFTKYIDTVYLPPLS